MKMKIKIDTTEFELEFNDYQEVCVFLQDFIQHNRLTEMKIESENEEDDGR